MLTPLQISSANPAPLLTLPFNCRSVNLLGLVKLGSEDSSYSLRQLFCLDPDALDGLLLALQNEKV